MNIPPVFKTAPESTEITEGDDLDLQCLVTGKPLPNIVWYKNNKDMSQLKNVNVESSETPENYETGSELTVKNVDKDIHTGRYTIEATNSVGTAKHELVVTGMYMK